MTVREQSGSYSWWAFLARPISNDLAEFIREFKPGGIILFSRNLESVGQIVDLTNHLQKLSPHCPLLISIDQEGGRVSRLPKGFTIFPPGEAMGRCNSYELGLCRRFGRRSRAAMRRHQHEHGARAGREQQPPESRLSATGRSVRPPRSSVKWRQATVAGLQDNRVVACGKHFPRARGHGG